MTRSDHPPDSPHAGRRDGDSMRDLFADLEPPLRLPEPTRREIEADLLRTLRTHHPSPAATSRRRSRGAWKTGLLAASILLAVLGSLAYLWRPRVVGVVQRVEVPEAITVDGKPILPGESVHAGARLHLGPGARLTLALGGIATEAASVRLAPTAPDEGSTREGFARLEVLSENALRLETGRLYFDRSGVGEPITLHLPWGELRDVGTQYLAEVGETAIVVRVREGRVEVRSQGQKYPVESGRKLALAADGTSAEGVDPGIGLAWDWVLGTAPPFELDGTTVAAFLDWVGRETGAEIRYASERWRRSAENEILHGNLPDLRPDRAVSVILPSTGWPFVVGETYILLGDSETPAQRD